MWIGGTAAVVSLGIICVGKVRHILDTQTQTVEARMHAMQQRNWQDWPRTTNSHKSRNRNWIGVLCCAMLVEVRCFGGTYL